MQLTSVFLFGACLKKLSKYFMKYKVKFKQLLADQHTPVELYLKLRDSFNETILLESSDYHSKENSLSLLCANPLLSFSIHDNQLITKNNQEYSKETIENDFIQQFNRKIQGINIDKPKEIESFLGLFGYTTFDAYQYFEDFKFDLNKQKIDLPTLHYSLYQFVLVFNHFTDTMILIEIQEENKASEFERLETIINAQNGIVFNFEKTNDTTSNITDEEFKDLVQKGKEHCRKGDVFQIVLSRQFIQDFKGDDFQVYRALRSINPSPYLFYFDLADFKIFGSSPEAQLVIQDRKAEIHPIAGTYKRTGNDELDKQKAIELLNDPKENAEHVMLVDLARNDLSKRSNLVEVLKYKEVQYYSHVIHLVSKVQGTLKEKESSFGAFADTFPAGTLSGAPKYKAIELIDQYENQNRSFYGGAIGFINFNGNMNQAIVIRSFLSKDNQLRYQAGAGVVINSNEESELQEVNNKLGALNKALELAEKL